VTTEAYELYAARPPARKAYAPEGGTNEGYAADDALMVNQGLPATLIDPLSAGAGKAFPDHFGLKFPKPT